MSKYGAVPTIVDNIRFASKREAERYKELRLLEAAGEITDLKRQVRFPLFTEDMDDNRQQVTQYIADFTYVDKGGQKVVEDAKGVRTAMYVLKKKWMLLEWGIDIQEV